MKKNESGRSMVEMLAVLAIMGVLSAGGLAGYSVAMRKLRSNSIMECVSAISSYTQMHTVTKTLTTEDDFDGFEGCEGMYFCINQIQANENGAVQISFKEEDECKKINALLASSIGCEWNRKDEEPYRGRYKTSGKDLTKAPKDQCDTDWSKEHF